MTPQTKAILNELAQTFQVKTELGSYYEEVRSLDETKDLISALSDNLNDVLLAEKRLNFMIGEVKTTIKRKI